MASETFREFLPAAEMMARAGSLTGTSPWVTVSQDMIDQFADATHDHQFIHVDAERAALESPFGGTIAHGFLSLSLLSHLLVNAMPGVREAVMGINYGFDKVRFLAPVRAGARIRGNFQLAECNLRKPNEMLSAWDVTIEIEGSDKPALAARWLGIAVLGEAA